MVQNNSKLTIGFVLDDTLDRLAGAQNYILTIGDYLSEQGHSVHYIVGQTEKDVRPNQHSLARNIKVNFSGNHLSIPFLSRKKDIEKLLDEVQFDVLHIQTPFSPFMSGKVIKQAHKRGIKIVGTYHILPYNKVSYIGNVIFGIWSRTYNRYFEHWINITNPSRLFSKKYYGIDGEIIRYPIDQAQIDTYCKSSTLKRTSKHELLFHGRLVERKGCEQLLKALVYLKQEQEFTKDWKLHISGDGPLKASLQAYVKKYHLESRVIFYGRTSEEQKYQLMQLADIVVYPAASGESFGVVLVEAIATKHPLILAGDNPGYASVLENSPDCLFKPSDTAAFAALIHAAMTDAKFKKINKAKQQKIIADYDIKIVAKRLLEAYI